LFVQAAEGEARTLPTSFGLKGGELGVICEIEGIRIDLSGYRKPLEDDRETSSFVSSASYSSSSPTADEYNKSRTSFRRSSSTDFDSHETSSRKAFDFCSCFCSSSTS